MYNKVYYINNTVTATINTKIEHRVTRVCEITGKMDSSSYVSE